MKYYAPLIVTAALLAGAGAAAGAGDASAEIVGLSVAKPEPNEPMASQAPGQLAGTRVTIKIRCPRKVLVGVDERASKLVRFMDDRGTDLSATGKRGFFGRPISGAVSGDDAHVCHVNIRSSSTPAPQARSLRLHARIALLAGSGTKVAKTEGFELKAGGTLTAGPLRMKLDWVGGFNGDSKGIKLTSSQNLDAVKKIEFFAPDGKKIESRRTFRSHGGFGGKVTYQQGYQRKADIDSVTVHVTYVDGMEPLEVPIDATVGVGLGGGEVSSLMAPPPTRETPDSSPRRAEPPRREARPAPGQGEQVLFRDEFDGDSGRWKGGGPSLVDWRLKDGKLLASGSDRASRTVAFPMPPRPGVKISAVMGYEGHLRHFGLAATYQRDKTVYSCTLLYRPRARKLSLSLTRPDTAPPGYQELARAATPVLGVREGRSYHLVLSQDGQTLVASVQGAEHEPLRVKGLPGAARLISVALTANCQGGSVTADSFEVSSAAPAVETAQPQAKKAPAEKAAEAGAGEHEQRDAEERARRDLSLADSYLAYERKDKAIDLYEQIIKQHPTTKAAQEARKRLQELRPAKPAGD